MAGEAIDPTADQVAAEIERLLSEALADSGIERALAEGVMRDEELAGHVRSQLQKRPAFLRVVASIAERDQERRRSLRRRRWTDRPVQVLTAHNIVLRLLTGLTGVWLAVVTGTRASGEITGIAIGTGVLIVAALLFSRQVRRLRRSEAEAERTLAQIDESLARQRRDLIERVILPIARERLNYLRRMPFSDRLAPADASGLGDPYDPEYEVPVAATAELRQALAALTAGSLGIAGPRGVGKTTLIRAACEGRLDEGSAGSERDDAPPGVLVSAPVRFGTDDFVRHLFAELCLAELGPADEQEEWRTAQLAGARLFQLTLATIGMAVAIVVTIVFYATGVHLDHGTATRAEIVLIALSLFFGFSWGGELVRKYRPRPEGDPIESEARKALERLRYLETLSAESSGKVSAGPAALGLSVGTRRGASLAAQAWTFPEVVESYRRFVGRLAARGPVIVGVDELDKMPSAEEARSFLDELKSLFDQPHVFYLVSISEEALGDFERRGQPIRDVFDSVFSDVLHVDYLCDPESEALLRRRVVGLPAPWPTLFHCMSGGLPRESIRVARRAVQIAERRRPDLATVTAALVAERVAAHEHAASVVARDWVGPDGTQTLLSWLSELPPLSPGGRGAGSVDPLTTREALEERMRIEGVLGAVRERVGAGAGEPQRLVIELAAGWHHALSCLEFFSALKSEEFDAARESERGRPSAIELLARGHQQLSSAPVLSWRTVESFRRCVGLSPHPYPSG